MATTAVDSANLILRLYEQRREPVMREARDFMLSFDPRSSEEYMAAMMGPHSAHVRMYMSYWEMAATLVAHGAIDAAMFDETNGEHVLALGKVLDFLPHLRQVNGNPNMLKNLEAVCAEAPGGLDKVRSTRDRIRGMIAARAAAASNS